MLLYYLQSISKSNQVNGWLINNRSFYQSRNGKKENIFYSIAVPHSTCRYLQNHEWKKTRIYQDNLITWCHFCGVCFLCCPPYLKYSEIYIKLLGVHVCLLCAYIQCKTNNHLSVDSILTSLYQQFEYAPLIRFKWYVSSSAHS